MKKLLNLRLSLLAVGLTAVMFTSTAAFGSENYDDSAQEQQTSGSGYYIHDMETGETRFVPEPEISTHSDETFGFLPEYDPYADDENTDFVQPFYLDHGRTIVTDPQNNRMNRSTVAIVGRYIKRQP